MNYKAIGVMSGSSLDGIDIVYAHFTSKGPHWEYEIVASECTPYPDSWKNKLLHATTLNAYDYLLLHVDYGKHLGEIVKKFISENSLEYKVQLIASHGHTVFHAPHQGLTHQLGEGAAIAATTGIPVVSDLRTMDVAFGGQGAPIVPIGEKKLFPDHSLFLNIGGIANLSAHLDTVVGYDVCPANRVLNILAEKEGHSYDDKGQIAKGGKIESELLAKLNRLEYYEKKFPKSLSNAFAIDHIIPLLNEHHVSNADLLCTYTEHIAQQISMAIKKVLAVLFGADIFKLIQNSKVLIGFDF